MPMIAITGSLRCCDMSPTGYPAHRRMLTIQATTNTTSAPSCARSTAEEAVRTRAEGSTCAAAEEVDTNSPYPPVERTMENARENNMR